MGDPARKNSLDVTRQRITTAGITVSDEQWDALPEPARKRVMDHPSNTDAERRRLAALVRWLLWEFPPGWSREG